MVQSPSLQHSGKSVRFRRAEDGKLRSISTQSVSSVTMNDGFTFTFQDGNLLRDNLAEAPRTGYYGFTVSAEKFVPLKQSELRQYYGPELYEVECLAQQALLIYGMSEVVLSNIPFWSTKAYKAIPYHEPGNAATFYKFETAPEGIALMIFSAAAFYTGLANCAIAFAESACLYSNHETASAMSRGWSTAELIGGGALALAGIGTMAYGIRDMKADPNSYRLQLFRKDREVAPAVPFFFISIKDGDVQTSRMTTGLMIGGAVAANVGLTMALMGGMRLGGWHRVSATSDTEWSLRPTSDTEWSLRPTSVGAPGVVVRF